MDQEQAADKENKTKRKNMQYSKEDLRQALQSIENKESTAYRASKTFNIPITTLERKLKAKNDRRPGNQLNLSKEVEHELVDYIINCSAMGSPLTRSQIKNCAADLTQCNGCKEFKNQVPTDQWFSSFLKRHPDIARRTPSLLTQASSKVSPKNITSFIENLIVYLKNLLKENYDDVINDPTAFGNSDESGFQLNPVPKSVYAKKGAKNVYMKAPAKPKESVSVMYTFLASGAVLTPQLILKSLSNVAEMSFAAGTVGAKYVFSETESGWQTQKSFFEYVSTTLVKELDELGVIRTKKHPFLYFFDGHKSHMSFKLFQFCKENHIIPIIFFPNSTHILQMADVLMFGPAKTKWIKVVQDWKMKPENGDKELSLVDFVVLLKKVTDDMTPEQIQHGFHVTGIFKLDPENALVERAFGADPSTSGDENQPITSQQIDLQIDDSGDSSFAAVADDLKNHLDQIDDETVPVDTTDRFQAASQTLIEAPNEFKLKIITQLMTDLYGTQSKSQEPSNIFDNETAASPSTAHVIPAHVLVPVKAPKRCLPRKYQKKNYGPMTSDEVMLQYKKFEDDKKETEEAKERRKKEREEKKIQDDVLRNIKKEKFEEKKAEKRKKDEKKQQAVDEPPKKRGRPKKAI